MGMSKQTQSHQLICEINQIKICWIIIHIPQFTKVLKANLKMFYKPTSTRSNCKHCKL